MTGTIYFLKLCADVTTIQFVNFSTTHLHADSYSIHGMTYTHDCIIEDLYPYPFLFKPPITIYFHITISSFLDTYYNVFVFRLNAWS